MPGTPAGPANHNGNQDFKDPVWLDADATIDSRQSADTTVNPNVTFEQTVDAKANSYYGLIVNDPGRTWFEGNVGHTAANTALGYLSTDAAGTTHLGSGATIYVDSRAKNGSDPGTPAGAANHNGNQDFQDPVWLDADATIDARQSFDTTVNPNVTFEQTLDSKANSYYGLIVNDPGRTWFEGNVGHTAANTALGYLTTDAAGTTHLGSGATIYVDTQAQNGSDAGRRPPERRTTTATRTSRIRFWLDADATIDARQSADTTVNPNVTFEQTLDSKANSYYGLIVNDPGRTWFEGNVGHTAANTALGYLTTDAAGTTHLGSGATIYVDTQAQNGSDPGTPAGAANHNGNQDFKDPVWLDADATIDARQSADTTVNPNVTFEQTVDAKANSYYGLIVNDPGRTWFEGNVGHTAANTALGYLTTDAAGTTHLGSGATIYVDTQAQNGSDPATPAGAANHNGNQDFQDPVLARRRRDDPRAAVGRHDGQSERDLRADAGCEGEQLLRADRQRSGQDLVRGQRGPHGGEHGAGLPEHGRRGNDPFGVRRDDLRRQPGAERQRCRDARRAGEPQRQPGLQGSGLARRRRDDRCAAVV